MKHALENGNAKLKPSEEKKNGRLEKRAIILKEILEYCEQPKLRKAIAANFTGPSKDLGTRGLSEYLTLLVNAGKLKRIVHLPSTRERVYVTIQSDD